MEAIPHGFAMYDEKENLALINDNFFKYRPELKNIIIPGVAFEDQLLERKKRDFYMVRWTVEILLRPNAENAI